ncbi:MAG TPA: Stp1/IreP family PP2C-type Ser/Thr phosphatase [Gaiellales bacterium]
MQIADHASSTHTGKVRRTNEDSYLDDPPLFVVADGMGGARAGEVASRIAIDTFRELEPVPDEDGEARLRRTILESNRRVLERSQSDSTAAGMGSTVTAALLEGDHVVVGHVGDSRAYLLRDGVLQQLSHDHSLVAELERAGRLTHEEAAVHPQRSVITRALGATPELEVDTRIVRVRDGDVLLLCSDGLSGLVGDDTIAGLIGGDGPLGDAVKRLVRAANDAGGDDNVTAVAFRIAGASGDEAAAAPPVEDRDLSDTLTEADAVPAVRLPGSSPLLGNVGARPRRNGRLIVAFSTFVLLIAVLAVGAAVGLRWAHFVGVDPATGRVAVFQGVPFELSGDHHLYRLVALSSVEVTTLPRSQRQTLLDHKLRSSGDAERILRQLQSTEP